MLSAARTAQQQWARVSIRERVRILKKLRSLLASAAKPLAASVPLEVIGSLKRTLADTLIAEVLPLAEACRFLEREAEQILAPQKVSARSRPFWLRRVVAEVFREPLGVVLILGPANYPLFLPGAQVLQALVAGNAAAWKPAPTGIAAAHALQQLLLQAGLPSALLTVLDATPATAERAIAAGIAKVVLTGHVDTGKAVLRQLAESVTPAVMELSACDAVFVLDGADSRRAAEAIAFGLRFNGSATCMAPRRIFVSSAMADSLMPLLREALEKLPVIPTSLAVREQLKWLMEDARSQGASVTYEAGRLGDLDAVRFILIDSALPEIAAMQTDIFAPLLSVMRFSDIGAALIAHSRCPYSLTAAVFGLEKEAAALARTIHAGTVLVNDVIIATADPRLSFGGREKSGFGVTRGREGLLEMTAPKTILTQRERSRRAYAPTTDAHEDLFAAYIEAAHAGSWRQRVRGMRALSAAARRLK